MRFKYLGTAAAEGFPALFCNCQACQAARESKGKNIRSRSQALVDDKLLFDFPPDTYMHSLAHGMELSKVKFLLVTHSHCDHFVPHDLVMRGMAYAHDILEEKLYIYGNAAVKQLLQEQYNQMYPTIRGNIHFMQVECYQKYLLDDYTIVALPARHMSSEQALLYIVSRGGKTILYGNDTGYFYEEVFAYIEQNKIVFDFISLDCTMVLNPIEDSGTHMGFAGCKRVAQRLMDMGALSPSCLQYVTHFSHNGNPLHEQLQIIAKEYGFDVSYDGLEIDI